MDTLTQQHSAAHSSTQGTHESAVSAVSWPAIFAGFRDMTPAIRGSGVRILAGTDWSDSLQSLGAAPGRSLHDELALLVGAGFTPAEALRAATSNPALIHQA